MNKFNPAPSYLGGREQEDHVGRQPRLKKKNEKKKLNYLGNI
jgi:hypothetical protein